MFKRSGNWRASWHDYRSPAFYHLTLHKANDQPVFGRLEGDCDLPSSAPGYVFVRHTFLGSCIHEALKKWQKEKPMLQIYQYCIMPDHMHLFLRVKQRRDDALGREIARYKSIANTIAKSEGIFDTGFNDQIIMPGTDFNTIFRYIRENPRRLAVRFKYPDRFRRIREISIGGFRFSAYGNLQFLESPFKQQVVVHRRDSPQERRMNRDRWLYCAANGGVLVSPFISEAEKEIRRECEKIGGGVILIKSKGFGERGKPGEHDFAQCEEGRLLILSPLEHDFPSEFCRKGCLLMNERAASICQICR